MEFNQKKGGVAYTASRHWGKTFVCNEGIFIPRNKDSGVYVATQQRVQSSSSFRRGGTLRYSGKLKVSVVGHVVSEHADDKKHGPY